MESTFKPLHEKLNDQFISFLEIHFHSDDLIQLAKSIDWKPAIDLFNIEFALLWSKMKIPEAIPELKESQIGFAEEVIKNIRSRLFNITYKTLLEYRNDNKGKELNENLIEIWDYAMFDLFRVFDYQHSMTTLNKDNNEKVVFRKIAKMKKAEEIVSKFKGGIHQYPKEIPYYEEIIKEYERSEKEGEGKSIRQISDHIGRTKLELNTDGDHKNELDNFYKRVLYYKEKKEKVTEQTSSDSLSDRS